MARLRMISVLDQDPPLLGPHQLCPYITC